MAELTTIARPYAEAVFELAKQEGRFGEWSDALKLAAAVSQDANMQSVLSSPRVPYGQKSALLLATAGKGIGELGENFLRLVLRNGRTEVLPEISRLFEDMKDHNEGVVEASVASAFPLAEEQLKQLVAKLESRFKRRILARASVDPELIGGIVVRVGDEVLDGSVRGKLEAMAAALTR
ncbi:MAG: F0F1 ATP synthase subunit delta [Burkholderiales bacterium]